MISSVRPADSLYNVTYYFIKNGNLTINNGKPMRICSAVVEYVFHNLRH